MRPWLVFLLLPACAGQTSTDNASAEDTSADSAGTTWYEDVEPLVQKSCATCHDGAGVGGVNLTDAATAQAYASGVRLFAFKGRKKELTCDELAIGRRDGRDGERRRHAPSRSGPGLPRLWRFGAHEPDGGRARRVPGVVRRGRKGR